MRAQKLPPDVNGNYYMVVPLGDPGSMVERVARALVAARFNRPFHMQSEDMRTNAREMARIAIEAMREPTLEMLGAIPGYSGRRYEQEVWRLMINAALGK